MLKNVMDRIDFQKRAMDASSLKHELIANNIANVETPNYKRKRLVFENFLTNSKRAEKLKMSKTNPKHMDSCIDAESCYIEMDRSLSERIDGNNVNIDLEMAEEAKNAIHYNALITQTSAQLRRLRAAIKGGR